jgi:long-chain acyl-CoA synthetase
MGSNVADLLAAAAAAEPHRIALSEAATGRTVTWAELDALADRVVHGLSTMGMVAGYRVIIAAGNRLEFVASYLGVLRARMVAVPVNPRSATGEVVRMIVDSGARMVIADGSTVATVRAAVAGVEEALAASTEAGAGRVPPRIVTVGTTLEPGERSWDHLVMESGEELPGSTDPESVAVLLYTSGASGRPRAAMLSHRALLANIEQVAAVESPMITGRDVVLGVLPLFHVYALNAVLGQVLRQHARLVLVDGFDPEGSLDIIEDEAVSVLPVAPPVFAYWMKVPGMEERFGPVKTVLSGSAPLDPGLIAVFEERTGLVVQQGYGLTEAAPVVTSTQAGTDPERRSVGAALPGIEIKLLDEDGRPPEDEDGGEILIRGSNLFSGYWPDGVDGPDPEGWWATGDVGFLDDSGALFLVDRLKDLIIVSGFNVYPVEVEEVIRELSTVAGVAVVGAEDAETGEAVIAYVKPAVDADATHLAEQVRVHCATRLASFKQPSAVHVVDALPLTGTGKVQKGRLREAERRRALGLLE